VATLSEMYKRIGIESEALSWQMASLQRHLAPPLEAMGTGKRMEASGSLARAAAECGQMMRDGQKPVMDRLRLVSEFERLRHSEIGEAAAPLSELGRLRMADAFAASEALDKMARQWAGQEHRFRSPSLGEAAQLAQQVIGGCDFTRLIPTFAGQLGRA
jgi:hypothetical protein